MPRVARLMLLAELSMPKNVSQSQKEFYHVIAY